MARVTVEDCIDKVESPYELVLVAKERATQLNSGIEPTLDRDNDKNTVIALREIAEENIKVPDLTDSAVYKLRKHVEQIDEGAEDTQRSFTFPTTVGLFDANDNLLAVAKMSRPIEKNDEKDLTVRVRLDF